MEAATHMTGAIKRGQPLPTDRDQRCRCRVEAVQPNRSDRRAARAGAAADVIITLHARDCPLALRTPEGPLRVSVAKLRKRRGQTS